ncbi:MAG: 50S ribosomal protein L13 [Candidatus Micrarchaeota archaeon]
MIVFDAKDCVAGRLASYTAKTLLKGEQVVIVNAELAILSGNAVKIVSKYSDRRGIQQKADPEHSPKWPRRPDFLLKRIIRGMLPPHTARRSNAMKNLRVFMGVPKEYEGKGKPVAARKKQDFTRKVITLGFICKKLGWKS